MKLINLKQVIELKGVRCDDGYWGIELTTKRFPNVMN